VLLDKKKKRRKTNRRKSNKIQPYYMGGHKSTSEGLVGFGTQINRPNDLQQENLRLQNGKLLENMKHDEDKSKALLELKGDLNNFKGQASNYAKYLNQTLLLRQDNVDVPPTGGSVFFDVMGDPNKKVDHHPNESEAFYDYSSIFGGGGFAQSNDFVDVEETPKKAGKKPISQMNSEELSKIYGDLGGDIDISELSKREKYKIVKDLVDSLKPPKKIYIKKPKKINNT
jgi:hypothetical protein